MKNNIKALTLASYLSMLFLGVAGTLIGAVARNIDLTAYQIGLFLTLQNVGFMLAVWISGSLADKYEKPRILLIGSLILAISFFCFYLTGILWLNLVIMILIGAGTGTYEGVTDAMLLEIHSTRQSLQINVNHFFVTFGAIVITVYLIFLEMNWRNALTQSAIVVLLLALFYGLARLEKKPQAHGEGYLERIRILARERLVITLFLATALVVGVEVGTIGILTTFLMDELAFTQTTSKIGLLTFLLGVAAGRLLVGFLSHKDQIWQYLLVLFGFAVACFTVLYYVNLGSFVYLSIFLAGLSISAILPLMITLAGQMYTHMTGTVIGSIKVAIPIGGILIPLAMSLLSRQASLQVALIVFPLGLLLAFSLLLIEYRRQVAIESPQV